MADKLLRLKDILEMDGQENPLERPALSFNDMHVTQYRPGEDELTNYKAYRRKRTIGVGEGGPIGESTELVEKQVMVCKDCGDEYCKPTTDCKNDCSDPDASHWEKKSVDEALSVSQRLARKRQFQRIKSKVKLGRERAKRRIASKDKLMLRARKQARNVILKKLTKDIPKGELTYARRQELEKRLEKPAIKARIDRMAKKAFPKVRQAELAKKRGGNR